MLKSNAASVNDHPSIHNYQISRNLCHLFVFDRQWKPTAILILAYAHQVLSFAEKTSLKPRISRINTKDLCGLNFHGKRVCYWISLRSHNFQWRQMFWTPKWGHSTRINREIHDMLLADRTLCVIVVAVGISLGPEDSILNDHEVLWKLSAIRVPSLNSITTNVIIWQLRRLYKVKIKCFNDNLYHIYVVDLGLFFFSPLQKGGICQYVCKYFFYSWVIQ